MTRHTEQLFINLTCSILQVVINLQKSRTYASLSSVKFFIRENPSSTFQTSHYTSPSTAWIVSEDEKTAEHHFSEVWIPVNPVFDTGTLSSKDIYLLYNG